MWGNYDNGAGENYNVRFGKIYECTVDNNVIIVKGAVSGVAREPWIKYTMRVSVDIKGKIDIILDGNIRENAHWLPRLGFEFVLPQENAEFEYYGNGPFESYCDMCHAGSIGLYKSSADKEYVNYIRPQEHGNHTNSKMLKIDNLCIESDSFEFNVSSYDSKVLSAANHIDELYKDNKTHVRIDYKVSGLGSNSCGPLLNDIHQLKEKTINFAFSIKPSYS